MNKNRMNKYELHLAFEQQYWTRFKSQAGFLCGLHVKVYVVRCQFGTYTRDKSTETRDNPHHITLLF